MMMSLTVALVLTMGMTAFAAKPVWTKVYKAEDGGTLKMTCFDESGEGRYTINLEGEIYENGFYKEDFWPEGFDNIAKLSLDGKINLASAQIKVDNEQGGTSAIVNESGAFLKSDNNGDANFHIAIFDEDKNAEDDSTMWYKIIKTYKLVPDKTTASPTNSKVLVDGTEVSFEAYNIDGNNYFKLRDLAEALSGSEKKFQVTWDGEKNAINLITGKGTKPTSNDPVKADAKSVQANLTNSDIYQDNLLIDLQGYTINDNNYLKLHDVGSALGFDVTWDGLKNTILIDTVHK